MQDEILAENNKVVMRLEDLLDWVIEDGDWKAGSKAIVLRDLKTEMKVKKVNNCDTKLKNNCSLKQQIKEEESENKENNLINHSQSVNNVIRNNCIRNGGKGKTIFSLNP